MQTLPAEILIKIALTSPHAWRGLLVVPQFAAMSTKSKFIRLGRKSFGLVGFWKKNYDIKQETFNLSTNPFPPDTVLRLPRGIVPKIIEMSEPEKLRPVTGPFTSCNIFGPGAANILNAVVEICHEIGDANKSIVFDDNYKAIVINIRPQNPNSRGINFMNIQCRGNLQRIFVNFVTEKNVSFETVKRPGEISAEYVCMDWGWTIGKTIKI